jgi:integrase
VAKNLSDLVVKRLPLPERGQRTYFDPTLPGFGVRVSQGGAKAWILVDPRSKTRLQETIGRYPIVSLSDARTEARRRLAEYTLGRYRPQTTTWDSALDEYLVHIERERRPRTKRDYARSLRHFPFRKTKLSELTPQLIQKKIDALSDVPSEQRHAFAVCRSFLNFCYRRHYFADHPMARMQPPTVGEARARILSDDELKRIWNASGDDAYGSIVKLLILTGQRVGETSRADSSMVSSGSLTLPSELTKNGREHTIPLCATARAILRSRPKGEAKAAYKFFAAPGKPDAFFSAFSKSKRALDKRSGVIGWTLHDLRRTFASGLAAQGVSIHVVEKILNHLSGTFAGIVGVYQRHDFFPEMEKAMLAWEAHINRLVAAAR